MRPPRKTRPQSAGGGLSPASWDDTGRGLSRAEWIILTVGTAAVAAAAGPRLWREWQGNGDYGHVVVTLPAAIWFLVTALTKAETRGARKDSDWLAAITLLSAATLCLLLDSALEEEFFLGMGLWAGALGAIALMGGAAGLKASAFGAALLLFAVPLPHSILQSAFHEHLQRLSASASAGLLSLGGIDSEASGTLVVVAGKGLNVAEACSGLKFISVLVFAALVLWRARFHGAFAAMWLTTAAVAVAFAANVGRLVAAGAIMARSGQSAAHGFLHGPAVYAVYAAAIAAFLIFAILMQDGLHGERDARAEDLACA